MVLKETLRNVVRIQRAEMEKLELGIEREALGSIDLKLPFAAVMTGVRQCGKSTLLRQLMGKTGKFHYFNFEDPRAPGFELADFIRLEEVFAEETPSVNTYFFDEIQNVPKWELYVRSALERKKHFAITGSNASLLSAELGTRLTGRHLNTELFPFSYSEYLSYFKQKPGPQTITKYLQQGGFPKYLEIDRTEILQELLQDILLRDIAVRHQIRNIKSLRELALYLLSNVGSDVSYNNLANVFSLGSPNTAMDWLSFYEDSYLLFQLPKFDYSLKKQAVNARKIYSIDNGLTAVNTVSFSPDLGKSLENAVFLALRRKHGKDNLFYFREKRECDFLVREKNKITQAIQVCHQLHEDDLKREMEGLMEAMKALELTQGTIVTLDQEDRIETDGKTIRVVPAWKWME
ncbi:MAG TPA: ATP-binding protein [Candidatus Micrarchaeota archaeon]|nr:ATP-binding protein [Candidatus Micrarchaeota archaeon]